MVFKLTGLNLTANNIGRIILSDDTEITEEIKTLLSNYSRVLDNSQKLAVQEFINGLKKNNLWSRIGYLYIPALAGNLSETMFNVKTNTTDALPNANFYEIRNNGFAVKKEHLESGTILSTSEAFTVSISNMSYMNMHFMSYVAPLKNEEITDIHKVNIAMYMNGNGANMGLNISYNTNNGNWAIISHSAQQRYALATTPDYLRGFCGYTVGSDGKVIGLLNNSNVGQLNKTITTDTPISEAPCMFGLHYNRKANCGLEQRIMSMGTAFTLDEMKIYNNLCDTLIAAIC